MWRENLDAVVGIQREKIGVSCDDVRCLAAHGDFEELIVFRIAASCNWLSRLTWLGIWQEQRTD